MRKSILSITALLLVSAFTSPAFAQSCKSLEYGMKKYGVGKSNLVLKENAEESVYYYFKLIKPIKGKTYVMIDMLAGCYTSNDSFLSNQEFKQAKRLAAQPRKDDEG